MSRTYRKKNYEAENQTSWDRAGTKVAGWHRTRVYNDFLTTYRVPTKEELYLSIRLAHGESKSGNSTSPGKWYRQNRMTQNRSINKQELHRFKANPDYEPMCEANPRSCWWDWD